MKYKAHKSFANTAGTRNIDVHSQFPRISPPLLCEQ